LAQGFAVASHDSGHQGAVFDASFRSDQQATLDFAQAAVPAVAQVGKAIAARFYGRAPAHSYMVGCSTGGRETMLAMERYPALFDGLVIGAPAMRTGFSNLGTAYAKVMFNQAAPRDGQGRPMPDRAFSAADRKTIRDGLLAQCDALDGLADGMVMAVAQCRFRPATLQCREGQHSGCLNAAQVDALTRAFAGPRDAAGHALYAPVPFDTGVVATDGPISGYIVDGRADILGPPNRDLAIDLDARAAAIRADWMQALTDTDGWTDLGTFLGHHGKVLFYHGVSDPWFSALDTLDYWQRAGQTNGTAWGQSSRFYMVPGMAHCRGGDAFDRFDLLDAVVAWVERTRRQTRLLPTGRRAGRPGRYAPGRPMPATTAAILPWRPVIPAPARLRQEQPLRARGLIRPAPAHGLRQGDGGGLAIDYRLDFGLPGRECGGLRGDYRGVIDDAVAILVVGNGFGLRRGGCRLSAALRHLGQHAGAGQVVFHLLERGQHGLAIGRHGLVVLRARLDHGAVAGAEVEQRHRSAYAQRPQAGSGLEQLVEHAAVGADAARKRHVWEIGGLLNADIGVGGRDAALRGGDVGPALEQGSGHLRGISGTTGCQSTGASAKVEGFSPTSTAIACSSTARWRSRSARVAWALLRFVCASNTSARETVPA
jgi:hypothetical protein